MAMKNSLCRCRVLAKIATSQPTTRRIPPSITLLLQQSSCYSTDEKEHSPPTTTPKNTPPLYKKSPSSTDFPRPKEIPFQAKVANSINLIGYIDMPIQTLVSSRGGKFTAATVITQEPSYHSPALRIPIIFEGDLAHIAASHLKKGDFVKIGGQLSTDPPPFPEMQDQTQVLVLGNSINFVEGSFQMKKSLLEQQLEGPLDDDVSMKRNVESGSNSWIDLLENPDQWWDYRSSKLSGLVKPKHPDFKHKNNDQPVWLSGAPSWIFSGLKKVKFDVKTVLPQTRQKKEEGFWKDLVENPNKWWDNRFNKKNPKSPDFKHKETGEGLWLVTSPAWVLPKLPPTKGAENVAGTEGYNAQWGQGST
ncbi:PROTEIN OSB2 CHLOROPLASTIC [Salix purpurea]|uniref:PROTEIN OSB2 CHLOROPLASTIC n=1 Tax=Salix purpurea TaxID=77065 RepID=A0A9Q1A0M0_SALPP|nr:PROTEIN OSB2 CHLOROPLASTIC [Salix purpurea]